MDKKTCKDCGIEKLANEFYANPRTKLGLSTYCKQCTNKRNQEWQHKNPERKAAYNKKYKSEHKTGMVDYVVKRIEKKRNKIAKLLSEINALKSQLTPPNNACSGQVAGGAASDGDSSPAATCH